MARTSSCAAKGADTARALAAARAHAAPAPAPVYERVVCAPVSSKDQEKVGHSIASQLRLLREHAASLGVEVVEEVVDVENAKRAGRTQFGRMLELLGGAADLPDRGHREDRPRLYRNITDWVTLDPLELSIHLVKENIVLSEESRSAEKFKHGIKVLMAKKYIDEPLQGRARG